MSLLQPFTRVAGALSRILKMPNVTIAARRNLPYCSVETNLKHSQISSDFHLKLSQCLANILNKDEKLVSVCVRTDVAVCRDGNTVPNAVVNIWSLGVFDAERNPTYSKQIYDFLLPELDMPADRIALFFHPISKETAGHLLYAELTAKK